MMRFEEVLRRVRQPASYVGGETNSVVKDPSRVICRVVLAYPDLYTIGMSYLGLQVLYRAVNDRPELWAERVFAPGPDLEAELSERGIPLCSLESRTPLRDFDLVGFTAQHELNLPDVLRMLELGGIPLRADERGSRHPLVILGGPGAAQPEPLAPALDAAFLGDGEEGLVEMARLVGEARRRGLPRERILELLQQVEGVYLPGRYQMSFSPQGYFLGCRPLGGAPAVVRRRLVPDLKALEPPSTPVLGACRPVHDRFTVEIQRGCTRGCRFCQAGMINRPVRQRSADAILRAVGEGIHRTGYDEVSLLSLSAGDHPRLLEVLCRLLGTRHDWPVAVSLPSLRAETLSGEMADLIRRVRKSGFTIAPEAGSERLRRFINKNLQEEDVLSAASAAFQAGWRLIKLYFMIGLPGETDEDRNRIVELVGRVRELSRGVRGGRVHVGISTFVPKAHTPLQWEAMFSPPQTQAVQERLRRELGAIGGVKVSWTRPQMSWLEGVLSRADRRIFEALVSLVGRGIGLLAWSEHFDGEVIRRAFAPALERMPDPLRERPLGEPLPWEHLDLGPTREFLLAERQRARQGLSTPDCATGECSGCGACSGPVAPRLASEAPGAAPQVAAAGQEQRQRVRLRLAKRGPAVFLGHLDFATQVARAMRRAGWPLAYSRGHHPQPRLSFGPACPVGAESLAEWLDVELHASRPLEPEELAQGLEAQLPLGITLEQLRLLEAGEPGIQKRARAQRWRLYVPADCAEGELERRLLALPGQAGCERPGQETAAQWGSLLALRLERGDGARQVVAEVSLGQGRQLRPAELAQELFGGLEARMVRECLLFDDLRS